MRWPPLFPSADKTRTKTAPAANKQKVTASADRKSEPLKSARIERADGTERSYLFFGELRRTAAWYERLP